MHAMLAVASGAGSEGQASLVSGRANTAGTALDSAQGQIEVASSFAAEAASHQVIFSARSMVTACCPVVRAFLRRLLCLHKNALSSQQANRGSHS